jgi:putative flippase GtrA
VKRYLKSFFTREAFWQLVKVGIIGVANTVVSFAIFNLLLVVLDATEEANDLELFWAVAISFALATFMSYVLNRRWAFQLVDGGVSRRETMSFFLVNLVAWGLTTLFVNGANALWGPLNHTEANLAFLAAAVVIIIPKFAGYRDLVFRKAIEDRASVPERPTVEA